jgi:hypothetical protein
MEIKMDTRPIIDYAQDDNGVEFRNALYASIHDRVASHIEAKKQEIAQNLITPQAEIEQEEEVAGIIELPLLDFLNEKTIVKKIMDTSYGNNIEVPTFKINEHYVWGATAMMMSELKEVLKSSFKN